MFEIVTTEYIEVKGTRSIWFFSSKYEDINKAKIAFEQLKKEPDMARVELRMIESGLILDHWNRDETNIIEKLCESKSFARSKQT